MAVSVVNKVTIQSKSTWRRYVVICLVIPFSIGVGVSIIHLDKATVIMEPFITKFMSYTNQHRTLLSFGSNSSTSSSTTTMNIETCFNDLERKMFETIPNWSEIDPITIAMHRNGQAESCGNTSSLIATTATTATAINIDQTGRTSHLASAFYSVLEDLQLLGQPCPDFKNKYHVEAFLTRAFVKLLPTASCFSEDDVGKKQKLMELGLLDYCDMGEDKTPILLDHNKLIPNTIQGTNNRHFSMLPCHFHTEHGVRVTSLHQFAKILQSKAEQANESENPSNNCIITPNGENVCSDNAVMTDLSTAVNSSSSLVFSPNELHLYAVPAGRVFMHVAAYVGQIIDLSHVPGADPNKPVYLEVLSVSPAVFDLHNFFTKDESAELVQRALAETKESHRIKRSTTGTGEHHVNNRRTSESGFDTDGATAITIKKRCFQVLGFDEYIESHGDGLQILRYNQTTAYIPHMDYLDLDKNLEHDYDSSKKGGNRFATILLYMTDLEEKDGGETVFIDAWPSGQSEQDHKPIEKALLELRESDQNGILEEGSWQEKMVAQCRTRLAIRPDSARAVLFYSQLPNGQPDPKSRHGGCPVLSGVKYAANLWVWNTPRDGYSGNPKNPDYKPKKNEKKKKVEDAIPAGRVTATFRNKGTDVRLVNAKLYFFDGSTDKEWGSLGFGEHLNIHTYKTHVWKVMVDGEVLHTFTIENEQPTEQEFVV